MSHISLYISLLSEEAAKEIVWAITNSDNYILAKFRGGENMWLKPSPNNFGQMTCFSIECKKEEGSKSLNNINSILRSLNIKHFGFILDHNSTLSIENGNIEREKQNHPYRD